MKKPFGLADRFGPMVEESKTPQELYSKAIKLPDEDLIAFFEYAADDHTWTATEEGTIWMTSFLKWFTEKFRNNVIPWPIARRAARAMSANYKSISSFLQNDVTFVVEEKPIKVNSLIFRINGETFFRDLIDSYMKNTAEALIVLDGVTFEVFKKVCEFINTGTIFELWKEDSKTILSIIEQANRFQLKGLAEYAFDSYKRYIEKETLFKRLFSAIKHKELLIAQEMVKLVNDEHLGFTLAIEELGQLAATLRRVWGDDEPYLFKIAPYIHKIICPDISQNSEFLFKFFPLAKRLKAVDFENAEKVDEALFKKLLEALATTDLEELNLSHLEWIDDALLKSIVKALPQLLVLNISFMSQISYKGYYELSNLKRLYNLNLNGHRQLKESDLQVIVEALKELREIALIDCTQLTDEALYMIGHTSKTLKKVTLSEGPQFSEKARKFIN